MASITTPTDSSPGMYSVSQLTGAPELSRKYNELKMARHMRDIQWKLNLRYYSGDSYSYYNKVNQRIEQLSTSDGEKPRYRIRLKSNQIMPGAQGLLAKMCKTKPVINATPGSSDANDLRAAQMSERLLEFWWDDLHMDEKLEEAILWAIIGAQGYWKISWDDQAGKAMQFTINPQTGQPITDTNEKAMFLQELQQAGIPPEAVQKTFYMGDVRVESISPFNLFLDPAAPSFDRAKYCFEVRYMDPDEVKARYGVWVTPDSVPSSEDTLGVPLLGAANNNSSKNTCKLITGYFLPTPVQPKGRIVCWAESGMQILDDAKWDFPDHKLPYVKFGMLKVPGSPYDSSVVEHAIPVQQELNRTLSQIMEYKNLTIKPRVWAPTGSLRQRITNEPGAVYEFTPIAGMKPEIETLPSMPPYIFNILEDISARLKDAFYTSEIDGGSLPPNVEAFTAIDLLQEMSSDKIAPAIKLMEKSIGYAGQQLLSLAQKYYVEPRLLAIKGANGSAQVKEFTKADITGGVTVSVESGSGLPRTRAGRMAQIQELVDKGYLSPQNGLKRMDIADLRGPLAAIAADEDQALREHDKIIAREPVNPDAVRQAIQVVNTPDPQFGAPVNPDTGQPFASPQEIQQYIHEQGLQPTHFEDYATHREQHALFMKSVEYEALPPDIQADFVTHYDATYQIIVNLPIPGVKGPNVNLQVKATAGPTAVAEILNRNGTYKVTPEQLMEPELPSWISDDLTKDPGMAQNNPEAEAKAAQIAQQTAQQEEQAGSQNAQQLQALAHAEEKHQQTMQHAHEKHHADLAAKKAAANKPKEKSTGKA